MDGRIFFRTVVFCVVVGVLGGISPADGGGVVVRVAFVGGEVDLFEKFGFVVFETADWMNLVEILNWYLWEEPTHLEGGWKRCVFRSQKLGGID